MPLIPLIGRKQPKMRLIILLLYTALTLGAVTMVYPFVVMLGTSVTSPVDHDEFRPVPAYVLDDRWLYRKYVELKYNEDIPRFNALLSNDLATFKDVEPPQGINTAGVKQRVADWLAFRARLPVGDWMLGAVGSTTLTTPEMVTRYREYLQQRYHTLDAVNAAYRQTNPFWESIKLTQERLDDPTYQPIPSREYQEFLEFKQQQPARYAIAVSGDGLFQDWLRLKYGATTQKLNAAWGTHYASRFDVRLPARAPMPPAQRADWLKFVREEMPSRYIVCDAAPSSSRRIDLIQTAPAASLSVSTPDLKFRDHLREQYRTIAALNKAWGAQFTSWEQPEPPYLAADWVEMERDRSAIRREFLVRNYREVIDYVALHGPAVWNTFVLCAGLLVVTLIVNPLCAYALSRYNLPSTYKILLFLLATMAFPAEVSAIPNFLLLKQLHLLNTYWALILPAMANGYAIFLLKGFFDSLPRELYEAGTIDGASEARMFTTITLPMSKPVLAVIALGTFTAAYGSFLWAFLVCQDPSKWTLMVWLSQMQSWAPMPVVFAALVLAAIPTLLVFVFCQNIIMRGIIVPTEK
jgi:ABC-type glycerol-3-phosphate transport system permease component